MQGNWVPSPQDEINHTASRHFGFHFQHLTSSSVLQARAKILWPKMGETNKPSEYESVTSGFVLLPMVSYKACKCSLCLLAGLCWWRLVEADSINGPSPCSWLSDGRVIRIWTATQGKSTLRISPLLIQKHVPMETSVKTQDLVVYIQCVMSTKWNIVHMGSMFGSSSKSLQMWGNWHIHDTD